MNWLKKHWGKLLTIVIVIVAVVMGGIYFHSYNKTNETAKIAQAKAVADAKAEVYAEMQAKAVAVAVDVAVADARAEVYAEMQAKAVADAKAEEKSLKKDFYKIPEGGNFSNKNNDYVGLDEIPTFINGQTVVVGIPLMNTPVGVRHYTGVLVPDHEFDWGENYGWKYLEIASTSNGQLLKGFPMLAINGKPVTHLWVLAPIPNS